MDEHERRILRRNGWQLLPVLTLAYIAPCRC
jgi:hypothetical protein